MRRRTNISIVSRPRKTEAAYRLLKYRYTQRKFTGFTTRRKTPKDLDSPVKTESGGTA